MRVWGLAVAVAGDRALCSARSGTITSWVRRRWSRVARSSLWAVVAPLWRSLPSRSLPSSRWRCGCTTPAIQPRSTRPSAIGCTLTGHLVRDLLLGLSEPVLTIGTAGVVAFVALVHRRWDVLTVAVAGPTIALLLSTFVLKPSINRLYGDVELITRGKLKAGYAFPSGHETGLASVTVLLAALLLGSNWAPVRVKAAGVAALTVWTFLGAAGLVRAGYHYATDTIGGFLLGLVLVLAVALVVDRAASRISSPDARSPSRIPGGA